MVALGEPNPPPVGAQDAEKCSHLLTPHFAHMHEMSFRIKYLCAIAVKSRRQTTEKSEQMLASAVLGARWAMIRMPSLTRSDQNIGSLDLFKRSNENPDWVGFIWKSNAVRLASFAAAESLPSSF